MNNQTLYTKVGSICGLLCCYTSGKENIKNKKSKYILECTLCVRYKAQICIDAPNVPEEGQQQRDSPNWNRELVFVIILVFFLLLLSVPSMFNSFPPFFGGTWCFIQRISFNFLIERRFLEIEHTLFCPPTDKRSTHCRRALLVSDVGECRRQCLFLGIYFCLIVWRRNRPPCQNL